MLFLVLLHHSLRLQFFSVVLVCVVTWNIEYSSWVDCIVEFNMKSSHFWASLCALPSSTVVVAFRRFQVSFFFGLYRCAEFHTPCFSSFSDSDWLFRSSSSSLFGSGRSISILLNQFNRNEFICCALLCCCIVRCRSQFSKSWQQCEDREWKNWKLLWKECYCSTCMCFIVDGYFCWLFFCYWFSPLTSLTTLLTR
jgi:hypothetical protein